MTAYHYIAVDEQGKKQKGVAEADSPRQLREQLRKNNLMPLEVNAVIRPSSDAKTSGQQVRIAPRRNKISKSDIFSLFSVKRQLPTPVASNNLILEE